MYFSSFSFSLLLTKHKLQQLASTDCSLWSLSLVDEFRRLCIVGVPQGHGFPHGYPNVHFPNTNGNGFIKFPISPNGNGNGGFGGNGGGHNGGNTGGFGGIGGGLLNNQQIGWVFVLVLTNVLNDIKDKMIHV